MHSTDTVATFTASQQLHEEDPAANALSFPPGNTVHSSATWPEAHPDDQLVDHWAECLKDHMASRIGRNRHRASAHLHGLSGALPSWGWDVEPVNASASSLSAGLLQGLYQRNMIEVAIRALMLHSTGENFDRRKMASTVPPQALQVAAQMRLVAEGLDSPAVKDSPLTTQQLKVWADQIETARDMSSTAAQLVAAPLMATALKADRDAAQAESRHNALVQLAREQGWHADQQHPGQNLIRKAAQERWEKELLATDLKREALQQCSAGHSPAALTPDQHCVGSSEKETTTA